MINTEHNIIRCATMKAGGDLKNNLKTIRKNQGLTQTSVARKANITVTSYQRIEYGVQIPSLKTALLIADTLHSTVDRLWRL